VLPLLLPPEDEDEEELVRSGVLDPEHARRKSGRRGRRAEPRMSRDEYPHRVPHTISRKNEAFVTP
jgi:hypothetical protein